QLHLCIVSHGDLTTLPGLSESSLDGLCISAFNALNITGRSSVVGISDSDIFLRHDKFAQPTKAVDFNRFNMTREVVHYETAGDDHDQSSRPDGTCGHGTHVSGIGAAPNAKIAFLDLAFDCFNWSNPVSLRVPTSTTGWSVSQPNPRSFRYRLSGQGKPDSISDFQRVHGKIQVMAKVVGTTVPQGPQLYSIVFTVRLQSK
ncbi:hypothetical protein AaE_006995, partial [Aphanomyces astaci]